MLPYAVTIFISAFLLFQVQLLLAKAILPWFGGAAAVWSTCMLFFQILLLAGYSYAHWLGQRAQPATQGAIHLLALGLALLALVLTGLAWNTPLLPDGSWKPGPAHTPIRDILLILGAAVGLPYLMLSATGPLLQAWFNRHAGGRSPYRLFALSNLGSLLGLLTYPFLFEVWVPLRVQAWIWAVGYVAFSLGMGWVAWRLLRAGPLPAIAIAPQAEAAPPPARAQRLLWFALPACASIMLLAITNQMSQEIAVNPFLWMLPLCLYLLSFILCFDSDRWYWRELYLFLLLPALVFATLVLVGGVRASVVAQILMLGAALFVVCMVCHGELVRHKPAPKFLTAFYLTLTAGGAMGGIFVGLLAPLLFPGYFELPLALWLTAALLFGLLWAEDDSPLRRLRLGAAQFTFVVMVILVLFVFSQFLPDLADLLLEIPAMPPALALGAALLAFALWKARIHHRLQTLPLRGTWLASLGVFGIAQLGLAFVPLSEASITLRNFYGVVQVLEETDRILGEHVRNMRHGRTLHGMQFMDEARRNQPGAYYHLNSGVGLAIRHHALRQDGAPMHLGVVGLGAGVLAAYGQCGDRLRFYEINPQVIRLAAAPDAPFTFVRDTSAVVEVVRGDARLALEAERQRNHLHNFDILVVDAFSSDAIPVHLLTREALALYLAHLAPDGVLALHVSNRYLDLVPVVRRLAGDAALAAVVVDADGERSGWHSTWVLLARDADLLKAPAITRAASVAPPRPAPLWRDDYSNLFQALHFASTPTENPLGGLID